jgi:hypothetical protein
MKKNSEALLNSKEKAGVEVHTTRHQTIGQDYCIKLANKPFECVAEYQYLGTKLEIRIRSQTYQVQIKFGECLLPSSSDCFVFTAIIQICKDYNKNYNFLLFL